MYEMYAKFYDRLNVNYDIWIPFIKSILDSNHRSIIEFGCGTGNILKSFSKAGEIAGVDISKAMLGHAKEKIPSAKLYLADMVTFQAERKYDVALCLFDSINHIVDVSDWTSFFENISSLLTESGVFIFDVNTTTRLELIASRPPMMIEFDDNYFYMNLYRKSNTNFIFDVRVLERKRDDVLIERREEIEETTASGEDISRMLSSYFANIHVYNEKKDRIALTDFHKFDGDRFFFVCS